MTHTDNFLIGVEDSPDYGITDIVFEGRLEKLDARSIVYVIDMLERCLKYCDNLLKEKVKDEQI